MAQSDKVTSIHTQRHLIEQLAYEEIRHYLSNMFVLDPVLFMMTHSKRPEDLGGQELRDFYHEAIDKGLDVRQSTPLGFREKFKAGTFFKQI
jgi:hypothetical protein